MSNHKAITNGNGTDLMITEDSYIKIGKDGKDIMLRGDGIVIAFDTWKDLVHAIDVSKSSYISNNNPEQNDGQLC